MTRTALTLEEYVAEMNRRLPLHPGYREGMRVVLDPLTADLGGTGSYTFEWPKSLTDDDAQSWFDTRNVVFDVELEMRELYQLEEYQLVERSPHRVVPPAATA